MRALRAVAAVLRTAAGLDAEQARGLDVVGIEVAAMNALRAKHQIREGKIVKRPRFRTRPVVPDRPDAAGNALADGLVGDLTVISRLNQPVRHGPLSFLLIKAIFIYNYADKLRLADVRANRTRFHDR